MYEKKDVPQEYMERWQQSADLVAAAVQVPAALVMRVWPEQIEVLISSLGDDNPYEEHEKADLGTGLYCETVMATRESLRVPNALQDPAWMNNPDIKLNMISYLGVPLVWPDDSIFGTVCVLDRKTRDFMPPSEQLLRGLKQLIEGDFRVICKLEREAQNEARLQAFEADVRRLCPH
ncbi:GAF domain-containing protein [Paucibacter sp. O1-1]|uniref:GAF domain-containing protein n=1 Tax=unclassified Roseateles TaxID=2626991 RepID=UPI0014850189|nr:MULTISPECIES: GAF domain-containing protein [unclassified Roseateles]MCU7374487.1 GAF domain-containing protein [Paucibacter sp. O1-1]MCZ7882304.1 GAF domain-containing protein [Paucibacter sp. M5-1]MDA3829489.1 GAF domain-containing protein [Paucibacter sp. O1-1]MDC6169045.1 GAF domain-containing protein [Paucibacter sp. XJ19-41]